MLQDWEAGFVGNNPGIIARMPRPATAARVVINLVRGRRIWRSAPESLPSAA